MRILCGAVLASIVVLVSATRARSADDAEKLTAAEMELKEKMIAAREAAIVRLEERLRDIRSGKEFSAHVPALRAQMARQIGNQLRRVKREDYVVPYFCFHTIREGDVGILIGGGSTDRKEHGRVFKVLQVIDEKTMLIEAFGEVGHPVTLDAHDPSDDPLYVEGVSTKDLTDGGFVTLPQLFRCTGTKTYGTALGTTRTVRSVEAYAIEDPRPLLEKLKQN
jgi:hypothetical protein